MTYPAYWKNYAPPRLPTPAVVVDVELTRPIKPLTLGPTHRAARVLVRLHGHPIGYADIIAKPAELIDHARILAALDPETTARAMSHLVDDLLAHSMSPLPLGLSLLVALNMAVAARVNCAYEDGAVDGPLVTVAICTRDRAGTVEQTLASLMRQTYRNSDFLVVDNAPSDDATEHLVHTLYPNVRYIREPLPGLDHARNRAINEARGEIIAFIDDDAIADLRWVQALVSSFQSPAVMCVTGLVAPARLDTAAQELFERFGYSKGFHRVNFNMRTPSPRPGFPYKGYMGTGCNSAFRRSVFDQVGFFDIRLDMGTPVPGGGDLDMFVRIIKAGYELVYDPGPVVFHDHVADMTTVIDKLSQYEQASIAYLTKYILADHSFKLLGHTIWRYLRRTTRGLAAAIIKKDRPLALVLHQAAYSWLGPIALYRSHRQAKAWAGQSSNKAVDPATIAQPESVSPTDSASLAHGRSVL